MREVEKGSLSSVFDQILFHARYLKGYDENLEPLSPSSMENDCTDDVVDDLIDEDSSDVKILSKKGKYNMILPTVLNIASFTSDHGTDQFKIYLQALKDIEDVIRTGRSIATFFSQSNVEEKAPPPPKTITGESSFSSSGSIGDVTEREENQPQ